MLRYCRLIVLVLDQLRLSCRAHRRGLRLALVDTLRVHPGVPPTFPLEHAPHRPRR